MNCPVMMRKRKSSFSESERFLKKALLEDNRVLIYESPLSLVQIASYRVICDLWSHHSIEDLAKEDDNISEDEYDLMTEDEYDEDPEEYTHEKRLNLYTIADKLSQSVNELCIPEILRENLKQCIYPTEQKLSSWASYQRKRIFFHYNNQNIAFKYASHLVWKSDGCINYLETGKNMVKFCGDLSDEEKFRVMSVYCMEDEILDVLPSLFSYSNFELGHFETHPLIHYWYNYVKGSLSLIKETFNSAESRMMISYHVDNEPAMKHFWSKLSEEDRIEVAVHLMQNGGKKDHAFVLSELKEMEQYELFRRIPHKVIGNFIDGGASFLKYVLSSWTFIKHFVTGDGLVEILKKLINKYHYHYYDSSVADILCKIWDDCTDHLKQFVLNGENSQLLNTLLRSDLKYSSTSQMLVFISKMLSDTSSDFKSDLLRSKDNRYFWKNLLFEYHTPIDDFVKICEGSEDDIEELKTALLNPEAVEQHCQDLLLRGTKDQMNKFLGLYFKDARTIADYKVRVLSSNKTLTNLSMHLLSGFRFNNLAEKIDDILSDPEAAREYKKKIAFSKGVWAEMLFSLPLEYSITDVKQIFHYLITSKEDQKTLKNKLLEYYLSKSYVYIFEHFRGRAWNDFLDWVMDGEDNAEKYKLQLPFDDVFQKLLEDTTFVKYDALLTKCKFRYDCYFDNLNKFMFWYCGTKEKVIQLKLEKIQEYYKINMINTLLKKKDISFLSKILDWFFMGDKKEIEKFRKKFPSNKISTIAADCRDYRSSPSVYIFGWFGNRRMQYCYF